ncbi:MAG: YbaK/EbsC family protein [Anaerolineae bacterium]|jgi:prolyl-tRNA editing enzyme YbaK/EbsC (Cys-tRNA(Pro) deacylase)|nr:YbaK/EbsC family protein [Anaerolineae bacterium]
MDISILTPDDVQRALDASGLGLMITFFEASTATSQQAADQIGCQLGQIAKSLLFIVDDQPIVIIASGDQKVDDKKLAALRNVNRKRVKIATPDQCIAITGYAPGGVPPLGYRTPGLTLYLDDALQRYEQIYAAAGAHNAIFPVRLDQLALLTGGTFADVKRDSVE